MRPVGESGREPELTVVIPTFNRGGQVRDLVERLLAKGGDPEPEIVVVDDGTTDGSMDPVREAFRDTGTVRILRQENTGPAGARNLGARSARSARVLFLDDHVWPQEGLVSRHVQAARYHAGAWVLGVAPLEPSRPPTPMDRYRLELEARWKTGSRGDRISFPAWELAEAFNGAHLAVDRQEFLALGGFDESIRAASSEDHLLGLRALRAGIRVVHRPDLVALHLDSVPTRVYARRQERYARDTARLLELAPEAAPESRRLRAMMLALGPRRPSDTLRGRLKRRVLRALSATPSLAILDVVVRILEGLRIPPSILFPVYRALLAGHQTRGWRKGRGWPGASTSSPDGSGGTTLEDGGSISLAVVVVNWNAGDVLRGCLASLREQAPEAEVWLADNASTDGSLEGLAEAFPEIRILENRENLGFAAANNDVLSRLDTDFALLLNPDAEIRPPGVRPLLERMRKAPLAALVSGRLVGTDGRSQHPARRFPGGWRSLAEGLRLHKLLPPRRRGPWLLGPYWNEAEPRRVDWVWGTYVFLRMDAYRDAGGFDEEYFLYGEDMEWAHRFWSRGWEVWLEPAASCLHHGALSTGKLWSEVERSLVIWRQTHRFLRGERGIGPEWSYRLGAAGGLLLEGLARILKRRPRAEWASCLRFAGAQLLPQRDEE